jgi:hypothetical protein
MASAAHDSDRKAVLDGIATRVTIKISPDRTNLFYATDIDQTDLNIKLHAPSYINNKFIYFNCACAKLIQTSLI